jgi:predicted ATPase/transcriptional regulator with XRE-family HTH domain
MEKTDSPVFFGEWVKKRRKALDLTQEELAHRAGCSVFALRKIESGERRPSKQLADLLAKALEVSSEEKQTFIKVARGETSLERLHLPPLDSSLASLSNLQPASVSNRIPLLHTLLVGRDAELAAMERLFNNPQCRLLTLTGMGGIGKTRLAIEFATRQQPEFLAGVFYVPLASIASVDAIVPAMAEVFGFVFSGPNAPKEQLLNYISAQLNQSALLVLDNLEHLLAQPLSGEKQGPTELISEFLQCLPNMRILTTSRERLNLQGEWSYELHGLAVPPLEYLGNLEDYSAATLFLQSASRVKADFELTATEQPALIQICQVLDGTPLALELAAAWVGMLSCQEIAQEIRSNIDFLTTSMRDIPERHRSLRATFDHSWKLLSDEERNALRRLSVFRGGFERMAAEQVAGATLPLLASLVSKSLVRRVENGRYDLHEVIRQYASSHLEEDNARCIETCGLHSEYYLDLASEYEEKLKSASQQAAMRDMSLELENLRTAWEWGIKHEKFESISKAIRSFGWFFEVSGLLRDGIDQLELLIQALQEQKRNDELKRLLGLTLLHQGLLYFRKGLFVRAEELYKDSIAFLHPTKDRALLADALIFLGTITHLNGDYTRSRELLTEGLECAQASNNQWFEAYAIYNLGYVDSLMGAYQKGHEQMLVGLDMWRTIGDLHYIALGLNFMVPTLIKLGLYEEAKGFMRESIGLCERAKNRWGMGTAYRYLGSAYLAEGQHTEAQAHFHKSLEIFGEYTEGWDIALSLYYLGETFLVNGNLIESKKYYSKALRISFDANSIPIVLDTLVGLAHIYAQTDEPERAFELSYYILGNPSSTQETKDQASEIVLKTEKLLTTHQVQAIKEGLLNSSLEDIVRNNSGTTRWSTSS